MAIELPDIIFTDQDDIVPLSGVEQIYNIGIVNTLAGNDVIIGTGGDYGFENNGTFDTSDGDDTITGTGTLYGIFIDHGGTVYTGKGNDVITGTGTIYGIFIGAAILNSGDGHDIITGTGTTNGIVKQSRSEFNSGDGNDIITGTGTTNGIVSGGPEGFYTEDGNDIITGIGTINGIINDGPLNTGNGEDSIISQGKFINYYFYRDGGGRVYLGDGNDSIIVVDTDNTNFLNYALENFSTIETGDGNDIITSTGISNNGRIDTGNGEDIITSTSIGISNSGRIDTGNGEDSIISQGKFRNYGGKVFLGEGNDSIIVDVFENTNITVIDGDDTSTWLRVINGVINTGEGNDSIIANGGFESDLNSSGSVVLGDGEDYIKGFGSGDFYGGNGNDTLELTPGSYSVGIVGAVVSFTKDSSVMITSEFEHLIAGGTIYDFTSLTECQTIFVA